MDSSTRQTINIIIDCLIIALSSVNICLSATLFGFIIYRVIKGRTSLNRVALLLTANMYSAILIFSIVLLEQYAHAFSGHLYSLIPSKNKIYCQIVTYFRIVSLCAIFYSNSLQSIYRLCRVVFHRKKLFHSFRVYLIFIIIQWCICFLIIIPDLLFNEFQYLNNDYLCQVNYTNLRNALINWFLVYTIPMYITIGCYVYTLKIIHSNYLTQTMTQIQRIIARRDLIVLFRICILLGLLLTIAIPTVTMYLVYISTGYLPWWSSQVQSFCFILSITSVTISLTVIFPYVRNLWKKHLRHKHHIGVTPVAIKIH